ncbi:Fc receptor-like protein 2 isoform X2 [Esox lucius]|uniref:Fc receptor-like protein 2 isoform X2 n=1 Tax=Esox lucius TaxID=8010 RepID=UPI001477205C|nr:Fc receptor-like protein 2 isoform X2 [Esox lucius]
MEVTPLYWILLLFISGLTSVLFISGLTSGQSPASLIVRPNRSQFFEYKSVSLSCEVQGGSTGWRVVRNPTSGNLTRCGDGWGRFDGTNCIISSTKSVDSGEYWCQYESGEHSNTVKIIVTAFLHISPDSSQFFEYDSLTVSCDVGWVVKRNTLKEETTECGNTWGKRNILDCVISSLRPRDSGQYWCESWSGDQSSTVNISVHGGHVILESPALPVTEGHSVTLNCRYKKTPSNLTADFYKDGSLIRNETTGEMTIPAVNKSDEGWYWCRHPIGNSSKSWITVSGTSSPSSPPPSSPSPSPTSSPPSSTSPPSSSSPLPPPESCSDSRVSLSRLLCSLLVVSPYLIVTTVLMVKHSRNRNRAKEILSFPSL